MHPPGSCSHPQSAPMRGALTHYVYLLPVRLDLPVNPQRNLTRRDISCLSLMGPFSGSLKPVRILASDCFSVLTYKIDSAVLVTVVKTCPRPYLSSMDLSDFWKYSSSPVVPPATTDMLGECLARLWRAFLWDRGDTVALQYYHLQKQRCWGGVSRDDGVLFYGIATHRIACRFAVREGWLTCLSLAVDVLSGSPLWAEKRMDKDRWRRLEHILGKRLQREAALQSRDRLPTGG